METIQPTKKLTLASASPRRRELLTLLGRQFDVVVPQIDETPKAREASRAFAERLAREKASAIKAEGTVIAADTIVVLGRHLLGKPTDAYHARKMLQKLSGRKHKVITGVCVRSAEQTQVFSVVTKVFFRGLTRQEIEAYIATGEPIDKAGAYAIQGNAAHMVRKIKGSYTNVVGLPLCELQKTLISFD